MTSYLIVDDEPLICKGIAKLISRVAPDWELCGEAWNGKEGIEFIIKHQPDLVFSDIRMPEMDGLAMSKQLIELAISTPIVFLTGYDEFRYIQQALQNNAFDYLLKPIKELDVRQVFERYEREYGVKKRIQQEDISKIKEYEFFLLNALQSQNVKHLEDLKDWYYCLEDSINLRSFIYLTNQVVNSYLLKYNIIAAEFHPIIIDSNTSNVLQKLQEYCISQIQEVQAHDTNRLIEKVKTWINQNIQDNLRLSDAAELVRLNPTYFSEYFKKCTGETFSNYVSRCKIERAKGLLMDHSLRVYDIAVQVGYVDHRHFSKVFQTKVGLTPTDYRNKVLGIG